MLIPFSTDVPVYHFPFATIGLIVVSTVIYFATVGACNTQERFESIAWLILNFDTINPPQHCRHCKRFNRPLPDKLQQQCDSLQAQAEQAISKANR